MESIQDLVQEEKFKFKVRPKFELQVDDIEVMVGAILDYQITVNQTNLEVMPFISEYALETAIDMIRVSEFASFEPLNNTVYFSNPQESNIGVHHLKVQAVVSVGDDFK